MLLVQPVNWQLLDWKVQKDQKYSMKILSPESEVVRASR